MIDQLGGVSSLYIDANILIYLVLDRGAKRDAVTVILAEAKTRGIFLSTSEITLAECLFGAFKQENEALAGVYRALFLYQTVPAPGSTATLFLTNDLCVILRLPQFLQGAPYQPRGHRHRRPRGPCRSPNPRV